VICQPGMPPVTTGGQWPGPAARRKRSTCSSGQRSSRSMLPAGSGLPGGVGQLEEDGERQRGLQLPRPLGRLGDLSDHLAHRLVLRFERYIGLGYHANEPILIVHDRQPPYLMLCHQVKRV